MSEINGKPHFYSPISKVFVFLVLPMNLTGISILYVFVFKEGTDEGAEHNLVSRKLTARLTLGCDKLRLKLIPLSR